MLTTFVLAHDDQSQSIRVLQTRSDAWEETFARYAEWFRAPMVVETESGRHSAIERSDIGRPIRALAADRAIETPAPPPQPFLLPLVGWWLPAGLLVFTGVLTLVAIGLHLEIQVRSGPTLLQIASLPIVVLLVVGAGLLWWQRAKRRWAVMRDDLLDIRRPRAAFSGFGLRNDPLKLDEVVSVSAHTVAVRGRGIGFLDVGTIDGAATLVLSAHDVFAARDAVFRAAAAKRR